MDEKEIIKKALKFIEKTEKKGWTQDDIETLKDILKGKESNDENN